MRNFRLDIRHQEARDRRSEPRYPAVDNTAELGWNGDRMSTTAAQLMDVSRSGLLVLADEAPPADCPVMIRLVEPVSSGWIEVNLVEARLTRHGPYQIRLSFRDTPPPEFLEAAINRLADEV